MILRSFDLDNRNIQEAIINQIKKLLEHYEQTYKYGDNFDVGFKIRRVHPYE